MDAESLIVGKSMSYEEGYGRKIWRALSEFLFKVEKWWRNAETRKHLADLPKHLYQDIGLTDRQVFCEVQKKFWQ